MCCIDFWWVSWFLWKEARVRGQVKSQVYLLALLFSRCVSLACSLTSQIPGLFCGQQLHVVMRSKMRKYMWPGGGRTPTMWHFSVRPSPSFSLLQGCSPLTLLDLHHSRFWIMFLLSFREWCENKWDNVVCSELSTLKLIYNKFLFLVGLPLTLGGIWTASLHCQLVCAMEKEFTLNISLMNTIGKEKYHVHSKIKHKCLWNLFVVLNGMLFLHLL